MADEPFSAEYFQHLLLSLTLNSRALIVELTALAESHVDHAQEIVNIIEERIAKILPKHKLYLFYLLDLIVKNIGNPYNLLFARNLYKIFTETYSIVDDTATRQNLINLFKTWMGGLTSAGAELFPNETLLRIEKFIIKATSLSNPEQGRLTRDMILREGNYLLQYIIALDDELELHTKQDDAEAKSLVDSTRAWRHARNNMIYDINQVSETVMTARKDDFERHKELQMAGLHKIRRALDDQKAEQQRLIKRALGRRLKVPEMPKQVDPDFILDALNEVFLADVGQWGKTTTASDAEVQPLPSPPPSIMEPEMEKPYLQGFDNLDFELGQDSSVPLSAHTEDDVDGYDPETTMDESVRHSPPTSPVSGPFVGKSSLKRRVEGEERTIKRVRFEV